MREADAAGRLAFFVSSFFVPQAYSLKPQAFRLRAARPR